MACGHCVANSGHGRRWIGIVTGISKRPCEDAPSVTPEATTTYPFLPEGVQVQSVQQVTDRVRALLEEGFGTVWDQADHQFLIFDGSVFNSNRLFGDMWKLESE